MADQPGVAEMMEAYALDACDHAASIRETQLDFTPESAKLVEDILAAMYDQRPTGFLAKIFSRGPSPEIINAFAKMYGGMSEKFSAANSAANGSWMKKSFLGRQLSAYVKGASPPCV